MKYLITGASGTVGKALQACLLSHGHEVVCWDRQRVPVNHYAAMERFVQEVAPDALFHLAVASSLTGMENESWEVNVHWPSELAWIMRKLARPLVYTSSVTVFSDQTQGPFDLDRLPDAVDGYGFEKRKAEDLVMNQNPDARVVRLGWQIGDDFEGNQMLAWLEREFQEQGVIRASTNWLPACSFLSDTVEALANLAGASAGVYHLDANPGWDFYRIVQALKTMHGRPWKIEATELPMQNQCMFEARELLPSISDKLKA